MRPEKPRCGHDNGWRGLRLPFYKTLGLAVVLGGLTVGMSSSWSVWDGGTAGALWGQVRNPRNVVVKSARKLYLFDGGAMVRSYPIKLGSSPTGQKRCAGDGRTPEGRFRVCTKNAYSANHLFIGIDYPDRAAAERGLRAGLISAGEARAIHEAHDLSRCPGWTTPLGGAIGLHGSASSLNETAGCIALSDAHVEELFAVLRIGDDVEILP